jgi:putative hydrolase of the HAD superfamily
MKQTSSTKALFLDIGGVLLTNGWGHQSRLRAAAYFGLDFDEFNKRHLSIFDTYESGKMSLEEYLELAVFYQPTNFSMDEFRDFLLSESKPYPEMIKLISNIKHYYGLRTIAVNNEPKEINEYRIRQYDLDSFIDVFASSCYVQTRKPDKDIYQIALNLAQAKPEEVIYIDDRLVLIHAGRKLGLNAIHHTSVASTRDALSRLGLHYIPALEQSYECLREEDRGRGPLDLPAEPWQAGRRPGSSQSLDKLNLIK